MVVGLGNPGPQYVFTRHNVGFLFLDEFLKKYPPHFERREKLYTLYSVAVKKMPFVLLRPLTFMNLSGEIFKHLKLPNLPMVVSDDLDLPLGKIRIKQKGSSGGHKGVQSIIDVLGTNEFPRLRVGIGPKTSDAVDFVLSEFTDDEMIKLHKVLELSVEAVVESAKYGLIYAMNKFNGMKVV
ncbi:aminoacyl-tRNA hydrolase [Mesoaciditoga sp.]